MIQFVILFAVLGAVGVVFGLVGVKLETFQEQIRNERKGKTIDVKFKVVKCESVVQQEENLKYVPAPMLSTNGKTFVALLPQKEEELCNNYFFTLKDKSGQNFRFSVSREMFEQYQKGDEITVQRVTRKLLTGKEVIYRYKGTRLHIIN